MGLKYNGALYYFPLFSASIPGTLDTGTRLHPHIFYTWQFFVPFTVECHCCSVEFVQTVDPQLCAGFCKSDYIFQTAPTKIPPDVCLVMLPFL